MLNCLSTSIFKTQSFSRPRQLLLFPSDFKLFTLSYLRTFKHFSVSFFIILKEGLLYNVVKIKKSKYVR